MSSEAHGGTSYSAAELRDAMSFYNVPGRSYIESIDQLDDLRGDGIDLAAQNHGGNLGDVNAHALQREPLTTDGALPVKPPCRWGCCECSRKCRCCNRLLSRPTICDWRTCNRFIPIPREAESATAAELTGDGCGRCGRCALNGDIGCPKFAADLLSGCDVIGWDDEPSAFAADYFAGDETLAGEWAENMLAADVFSEDDLYALGWDPFKSIKKAVKPLAKTVKAATKAVGKVTSAATKVVGKVPIVGKVAASGLRTATALTTAGLKLNPVSILKNPKAAFAAQVAAAKSAVSTATQTLSVAKQLAKSPVVKAVVGGAAVVFPPIGVPAAAALATAAAVANAVDSKVPAARAAAQKVIENTARLAQAGDKGAEIALSEISTQKQALLAKKLQTAPAGAKRLVFDVTRQGRISRVAL